jgi:hypothetical protein
VKDLTKSSTLKKLSGWNQVPMKVKITWCDPPISNDAELVALPAF